jgi:HK97 gp10 family phage protein
MSVDFNLEGTNEIIARLERFTDISKIEAAMRKACLLVERDAKKEAPKDTGALRRSITSKVTVRTGEITGTVFTPLEYAPYVEYGTGLFAENGDGRQTPWRYKDDKGQGHTTSGQQPHPFLRPAYNKNKEEIKRILKEGLSDD